MSSTRPTSKLRNVAGLALAFAVSVGAIGGFDSAAMASPKAIDWDKKLAKPKQLMTTNNIEEAVKIYEDLLKKHADSGAVHTELGKCYKRRGKGAAGKAEFARATEVEPTYADAWYELGCMNQSDKEYDLAVSNFQHYIQLVPSADNKAAVLDRIKFCKAEM